MQQSLLIRVALVLAARDYISINVSVVTFDKLTLMRTGCMQFLHHNLRFKEKAGSKAS